MDFYFVGLKLKWVEYSKGNKDYCIIRIIRLKNLIDFCGRVFCHRFDSLAVFKHKNIQRFFGLINRSHQTSFGFEN